MWQGTWQPVDVHLAHQAGQLWAHLIVELYQLHILYQKSAIHPINFPCFLQWSHHFPMRSYDFPLVLQSFSCDFPDFLMLPAPLPHRLRSPHRLRKKACPMVGKPPERPSSPTELVVWPASCDGKLATFDGNWQISPWFWMFIVENIYIFIIRS